MNDPVVRGLVASVVVSFVIAVVHRIVKLRTHTKTIKGR